MNVLSACEASELRRCLASAKVWRQDGGQTTYVLAVQHSRWSCPLQPFLQATSWRRSTVLLVCRVFLFLIKPFCRFSYGSSLLSPTEERPFCSRSMICPIGWPPFRRASRAASQDRGIPSDVGVQHDHIWIGILQPDRKANAKVRLKFEALRVNLGPPHCWHATWAKAIQGRHSCSGRAVCHHKL